uniref:Uncharacterized protein n=1 Tax=Rhizophora mucronata TaxID=61149 RepID=A0A2P2PHV9_RHIMU
MQEPRMPHSREISKPKPPKKKASKPRASTSQLRGNDAREVQQVPGTASSRLGQKSFQRNLKNEVSSLFQQVERSSSDSMPESTTSADQYRALRRKYLLLEEESFALGSELREVEDEVKVLEDEKLALLDELVVLEGLIDPPQVQPQGLGLP